MFIEINSQGFTIDGAFKLVPVEPIAAMVEAAYAARLESVQRDAHAEKLYREVGVHFHPGHDWRAMLAASPPPPSSGAGEGPRPIDLIQALKNALKDSAPPPQQEDG